MFINKNTQLDTQELHEHQHQAELKLIALLLATNTAKRVLAIGSPPTILILAASSLLFYLHHCRTPTFSWSIFFLGDAMQDGSSRLSSLCT